MIDAVGGGTKLLMNNRRWGLVLNHSRAMLLLLASRSLHGWHMSSNPRAFLARLVVPFSSTPRRYGVYDECRTLVVVL